MQDGRRTWRDRRAWQGLGVQAGAAVGTSGEIDAGELSEELPPIQHGTRVEFLLGASMVAVCGVLLDCGASEGELGIDVASGVEAEVSHFDEASGQDV